MKVLVVVPGFPYELGNIQGGVHSAVNNLLAGFANLPVEIRVVSFNKELDKSFISKKYAENIRIHYYRNWNVGLQILSYLTHGAMILRKEIKSFGPDIIHYEEGMAFLLMRTWGVYKVPELLTIHGIIFAEAKLKKKWSDKMYWYLNGIIERLLVPGNVIHLSNYSKNIFNMKGINFRSFEIIPNAVTDPFFNIPQKTDTGRSLLYIGVIDENKNLIYLLTCLNELKKRGIIYSLVIAGDFNSDTYISITHDFIKQHDLSSQIEFLGWIGQQEIRKRMHEADMLVVSSKQESLPMVIAEAMAAGKLVLASKVGGIPEMIEDGETGFLFSNDNPQNLVNLLERIDHEPELISKMGEKAKKKATATYQSNAVAAKTLSFYKKILAHNK